MKGELGRYKGKRKDRRKTKKTRWKEKAKLEAFATQTLDEPDQEGGNAMVRLLWVDGIPND